jgi:hypothetical protein
LKTSLLKHRALRTAWGAMRRTQLHREYIRRREHYRALADGQHLAFDEATVISSVRARLAARGYHPRRKTSGHVHTLAFIPHFGWHEHLIPDLRELGLVTRFDYTALGYELDILRQCDARAVTARERLSHAFVNTVKEVHGREPVDWIFVYANGSEISARAIRQIVADTGLPVVNMCLDDKHSWQGTFAGGQHAGQIDIAREFDVSWTSSRVACEWYLVEGARPIYMPEGFDGTVYRPTGVEPDIPISFVGRGYGYRMDVIHFLRTSGIPVQVFGPGWSDAQWAKDVVNVFNRSRINLGMGGIGYSESLTTVKGRDFEVPGTGGGMYLTSYNADLAQHFTIGHEIACYASRSELLELTRHYLSHDEEARQMAIRARQRSLQEHRWLHRYVRVCEILQVL